MIKKANKVLKNQLLKLDRLDYPFNARRKNSNIYFEVNEDLKRALLSLNYKIDVLDGSLYLVELKSGDVYQLDEFNFKDLSGKFIKLNYYTKVS